MVYRTEMHPLNKFEYMKKVELTFTFWDWLFLCDCFPAVCVQLCLKFPLYIGKKYIPDFWPPVYACSGDLYVALLF